MQRFTQIKTHNGELTPSQRARIKNNPNTIYCDRKTNTCYWTSYDSPNVIIKNILK